MTTIEDPTAAAHDDGAAEADALGYRPFDADNHYYEALDAFSRHLDPALGARVFQWAQIDGRTYPVLGGKVFRGVRNATFDPVARPGVLADYFRGNPHGDDPIALLRQHEPIRATYRDRDARVAQLDAHGLEAAWLFPTLGMIYEEPLVGDVDAVCALFTAFNRWVDEDWGFAYRDRLFAAPYITLVDVEWACAELERALDRGARTVVMRPGAPTTRLGPVSPADRANDPFWARVDEAGITVVVHAGDSGYTAHGYAADGFSTDFGSMATPIRMLQLERPIEDFLAACICENLFHRFPNIRIASVENGSGFLPGLFHRLEVTGKKIAGWWPEDPIETFRRHIWINPFWEDQVDDVIELMGADRVLFGSDWPHIEALPRPLDYLRDVAHLDAGVQRQVLQTNARELNELRPK